MPDFIIIGAMKCATSTLHEQLAQQRGVFMSTPKEPNFFSDDGRYGHGLTSYSALFSSAPLDALCGESSTHYTKLPTYPRTVTRMHKHLPEHIKFIYIIRHPIDRLVSQYIHEWTQRVVSCPIDEAIDRHPELIAYSRYAMQLEPYFQTWGRERVLPVFFDHLSLKPQEELERVCRFIGFDGSALWNNEIGEQNASSERLRRSALRDAVVNFPGVKALRRKLVPQSLRDRVKRFWMMKQRPELSTDSLQRLREVFDDDLGVLGGWMGLSLRCDTLKSIARETAPAWRSASTVSAA
jgi:hypothetical protein